MKLVKRSQLPELNENNEKQVQEFGTSEETLEMFELLPKLSEVGDTVTRGTAFRRQIPGKKIPDETIGVTSDKNTAVSAKDLLPGKANPEDNAAKLSDDREDLWTTKNMITKGEIVNNRYPTRTRESSSIYANRN